MSLETQMRRWWIEVLQAKHAKEKLLERYVFGKVERRHWAVKLAVQLIVI